VRWTTAWGGKLKGLATISPVVQPKTPHVQVKRSSMPPADGSVDVPLFLAHVSSVDDDVRKNLLPIFSNSEHFRLIVSDRTTN
jgi:hypothetical protein